MFSKSLFKQSCKANGIMWIIITGAVCFMLASVMLIAGNGKLSMTREAIHGTVVETEVKAKIEDTSLSYYITANDAMEFFEEKYTSAYQENLTELMTSGMAEDEATATASQAAYAAAAGSLSEEYVPALLTKLGYEEDSEEADAIKGVIFATLNPMQEDGSYMFDDYYLSIGEEAPRYETVLATLTSDLHNDVREKYVMDTAAEFLAGHFVSEENNAKMMEELSGYGITDEQYAEFGYTDYAHVKNIAESAIVEYRSELEYRLDNMTADETEEGIKEELAATIPQSLLSQLPEEVSDAIDEIGQMDLYGILVGSIFFKMAGLLLPIIYMIMASNALISGQVDSGSMAYILSTSTKRRTIAFTQAVYLAGSLLVMFILTTITSVICFNIADVNTDLDIPKLLFINLDAFLVMFAMSGISFLASCFFNRSKNAMAVGGGLNMFFLVATMLGLFGSPVLPSIIRMNDLNTFNYVSIISLFDVVDILNGGTDFIYKMFILVAVGLICYITGSEYFTRKDLPL